MTAKQVLNAKPGQKVGLGNGLRLVCDARNGARYFELRKRVRGKDYSWGVGSVETLTIAGCNKALSLARQQADKILDALASGADPSGIGKSAKSGEVLTGRSPLRDVARQYVANKGGEWSSERHRADWLNSLEMHCSWLMDSPIADITLDSVIEAIQPHWSVRTETASRMRAKLSRIFSYTVVMKLRNDDPADWKLLSHVLPQQAKIAPVKHRVAMEYQDCPALYKTLSESDVASSKALQWVMLSACRSKEGRHMTWDEVDVKNRVWTLKAERTKQRRDLRIPITGEMLKLIEWAEPVRRGDLVLTLSDGPLSDQAISKFLKRHTFQTNTVHGLRTSFRTWCQETGVDDNLAEMCLGHLVGSEVRRAYARSDLFEERLEVMSRWSEYLTSGASISQSKKRA